MVVEAIRQGDERKVEGRGLQRKRATEDVGFYPHDLIGQRTETRPDHLAEMHGCTSPPINLEDRVLGRSEMRSQIMVPRVFLSRDPLSSRPCDFPICKDAAVQRHRLPARTGSARRKTGRHYDLAPRYAETSRLLQNHLLRDLQRPFVGTLHVLPITMISPGARHRKYFFHFDRRPTRRRRRVASSVKACWPARRSSDVWFVRSHPSR